MTSKMLLKSGQINRTAQGTRVVDVWAVWTDSWFDPVEAFAWVPAHDTPHSSLTACLLSDVSIEPTFPFFTVTLTYTEPVLPSDAGREFWSFAFGATQEHITSVPADSYIQYWPAAANDGLAIGWDGDKAEGCDVYRPTMEARCIKTWDAVPVAQLQNAVLLQNTLNSAEWFTFQPGELLFNGATMEQQPDGRIRVEYTFSMRKRRGPQTVNVGPEGTPTTVEVISPWDHVWTRQCETESTDENGQKATRRYIKYVAAAQVYDYDTDRAAAGFALLGLIGPFGGWEAW